MGPVPKIKQVSKWGGSCLVLKVETRPGCYNFWYWNLRKDDWDENPVPFTKGYAREQFMALLKEEGFNDPNSLLGFLGAQGLSDYNVGLRPTLWEHLGL